MTTIKQALAILILISGVFIIAGCPAGADPGPDLPNIFFVIQENDIKNGRLEVDRKSGGEGEVITITAHPNSG